MHGSKIASGRPRVSGRIQGFRSFASQGAVLTIRFGPLTLDLAARQLARDSTPIHLEPKAFDLLAMLALARPNVVTKAELQERLWPGTFVVEANLSNLVAEIREALGDPARAPRVIRTVHRVGYAFCADVETAPHDGPGDSPVCFLEWGRRSFPLSAGEHLLGRDADLDIQLDASTVSRRHARLVVTEDRTMLEDFGSKNGTYRGDERVTSPVQLADGDAIRIGSQLVIFRLRSRTMSTELMAPSTP